MITLRLPNTSVARWASDILDSIEVTSSGCWLWRRACNPRNQYGQLRLPVAWENRRGRTVGAHVFMWLLVRGLIPKGCHVDHICRVKICVNPWHLQLLGQSENIAKGNADRCVAVDWPDEYEAPVL